MFPLSQILLIQLYTRYIEIASELLRNVSQGLQVWVASNDPSIRAPIQLKRNLQMFYSIAKELVSMKMLGGVKATGKVRFLMLIGMSAYHSLSSSLAHTRPQSTFIPHYSLPSLPADHQYEPPILLHFHISCSKLYPAFLLGCLRRKIQNLKSSSNW
jgi:hypothetical protein